MVRFQGRSPSFKILVRLVPKTIDRAGEGTTEVGTARKRHVRTKSGSQPPIRQNPAKSVKIRQNPAKSVKIRPEFTADQLHLAKLPVTAGGLGLPDLPVLALIARTAALRHCPGQQTLIHSDMT